MAHHPSSSSGTLAKGQQKHPFPGEEGWLHHSHPHPHPHEKLRPCMRNGRPFLYPLLSRVLRHCPKPSLPTCDRREKRSALGVDLAFLTLAPYAADHDYLESHYVYTRKTAEAHRTQANGLNAKRYRGVSSGFGAPVGGVGGGGFVDLPCHLQRQMEPALS